MTAAEMGAEAPESEKLVAEQDKGSQNSGSQPLTSHEESQDPKLNTSQGEKPQRFRKAVFRCMKRVSVSPLYIFKRARDCYISGLGDCAQSYGTYQPGFGGAGMTVPAAFSPGPANYKVRQMEAQQFDEDCLSPAFKRAFNEAAYSRSASYMGHEGAREQFRKSLFANVDNGMNPTMRRAYSEATAFSRFPRSSGIAYRGPSPGWTPNRIGAGIMYPIQETPEYIRPSLRKVSDDTTPLSDDDDFSFKKNNDKIDEASDSPQVKDDSEAVKGHPEEQKDDATVSPNEVKDAPSALPSPGEGFQNVSRHPTPALTPGVST